MSRDADIGTPLADIKGTVIGMQYIQDNVDMSKVSPNDLPYMKDIVMGILTFDRTMPKLRVRVIDTPGEYVIRVEDFSDRWGFSVKAWNATFMDTATRDHKYVYVMDTKVLPYSKSLEITVKRAQDTRAPTVVRKTKAVQVQRRASSPPHVAYRRPNGGRAPVHAPRYDDRRESSDE
jgi:hypothetical protein